MALSHKTLQKLLSHKISLCNKILHTKSQWVYICILSHKTLSHKNCRICMHGLHVVELHTCRPDAELGVTKIFFFEGCMLLFQGVSPAHFDHWWNYGMVRITSEDHLRSSVCRNWSIERNAQIRQVQRQTTEVPKWCICLAGCGP